MTIPVKKISTFCKTGSGGTPSRSNNAFFENGTIPWVKSGELKNRYITEIEEYITDLAVEKSSAKLVSKGSLLIAMYGATVGEVSQLTFDATTNQAICNIQPDENVCDVNYLYRFLEASKPYLLSRRVGGGQPNISQSVIKDLDVPLPPLSEQRRIASILDQADELRQKRQQAIEKLDQLLQATFIDMFGDPEKNPKKWNKVVLGDICDQKDRVNYGVVQPGNEFEGGVPLIRVGDIDGGILSFHLIKRIDPEIEKDYSRSRIKGNEVLVSCVGSIGTIAKVPNEAIGFNIARAITRVPLQDKRIINFVAECLKTEAIQNYFKKNTRTVSQPTLNVSFVKETEIIFPNEEKILDFCKIVDKVEFQKELLQKALVMQESLFQSLQNQAFNGTL